MKDKLSLLLTIPLLNFGVLSGQSDRVYTEADYDRAASKLILIQGSGWGNKDKGIIDF